MESGTVGMKSGKPWLGSGELRSLREGGRMESGEGGRVAGELGIGSGEGGKGREREPCLLDSRGTEV